MSRKHIVTGLDIGTTKIVVVSAEVGPNGYPVIIGFGKSPTIGVRKGVIFDRGALVKSISHAVEEATVKADLAVKSVYASFPAADSLTDELEVIDDNMAQCVMEAGLQIKNIYHQVVASAEAVLTDTDKNLGTAVIDIGGSNTGLAVFDQGELVYHNSLILGSDHITSDLALCLRTTLGEAERLKRNLGIENSAVEPYFEVTKLGGSEKRKVSLKNVEDISRYRAKEIFELAHQNLKKRCRLQSLSGGLVLTGGGALLKGMLDLASEEFPFLRVKIGATGKVGVPQVELAGPEYTSAAGLVILGAKGISNRTGDNSGWLGVLSRLR